MSQTGDFVVTSEVEAAPDGEAVLERAFRSRLGEVEQHPGFRRLEVWRDTRTAGRYLMVSWWRSREDFRDYMAGAAHHRSHARIPGDPHAPRGRGVDRFELSYQVVTR